MKMECSLLTDDLRSWDGTKMLCDEARVAVVLDGLSPSRSVLFASWAAVPKTLG